MEMILILAAVGGVAAWHYMNYKRVKDRNTYLSQRIDLVEKHLGLTPPPPPE